MVDGEEFGVDRGWIYSDDEAELRWKFGSGRFLYASR